MGYRIARVTGLIYLPLRTQIEQDGSNQSLSYQQLSRKIFDLHYSYSDSFQHSMEQAGHEAIEILYDVQLLQKKWAEENDVKVDFNQPWQLAVLLEQLKAFNPDFIYFQGVTRFTPAVLEEHRYLFPNLKRYFLHTGFPGGLDQLTPDTTVFCGLPSILEVFKAAGYESELLYHAFDERLLSQVQDKAKTIEFSFTGTSGYLLGDSHSHRFWDLLRLAHATPMQLWLDEKKPLDEIGVPFQDLPLKLKPEYYSLQENQAIKDSKPLLPLSFLVEQHQCHPAVYGLAYYQVLANSRLTYHRHTQAVSNEVGAMRLFQATGMGACLVTDSGANMTDLFKEDTEVVTYRTMAECVDKVNYLLDNPEKANQIAQAGQKRILTCHTYEHRYALVRDIIEKYI